MAASSLLRRRRRVLGTLGTLGVVLLMAVLAPLGQVQPEAREAPAPSTTSSTSARGSFSPVPPDAWTITGDPSAGPRWPDDLERRLRETGALRLLGDAGPTGGLADRPSDLPDLMGRVLGPDLERLPLPEPDPDDPLQGALAEYARVVGADLPDPVLLDASVQNLGLGAEGQAALARLVLAYTQSVELQRAATAGLTPWDRAFVGLDPATASDWFSEDPERTWDDYHAEAVRILDERGDRGLTLQAADLLARAVDAARGPLAHDRVPAPAPEGVLPGPGRLEGPLRLLEYALQAAAGPDAPEPLRPSSLAEALGRLYEAYGLPAGAVVPPAAPLPPSLEAAVADIVAVKAAGLDAPTEALRFLHVMEDARPVLEAWGAVLAASDALAAPVVLPPDDLALPSGAPVPPSLERSLAALQRARDDLLASLTPAEAEALERGDEALALLGAERWTPEEAGLVAAWASAQSRTGQGPADALQETWDAAVAALDAGTVTLPASNHDPLRPVREALENRGVEWPIAEPDEGVLYDDAAYLDRVYGLCASAGTACSGPVSLLRVGGEGPNEYASAAVVHIDLGGDDRYLAQVAGPATVQVGDDGGNTVTLGSYSIDLDGDDAYDTPDLSSTQGSASNGASILLDARGDDTYAARERAQGHARSTLGSDMGGPNVGLAVGLLLDLGGDDRYAIQGDGHAGGVIDNSLAALLDLSGDDEYSFQQQGTVTQAIGVGMFVDAAGTDSYTSSTTIPTRDVTPEAPANAFQFQGFITQGAGLALFLDAGDQRDTYAAVDVDGEPLDLTDLKNDRNRVQGQNPSAFGAGAFLDGVDTSSVVDTDEDGAPDTLEGAYGTDPNDDSSHPGNLFWAALRAGDADPQDPDPERTLGLDRQGPWLRTPAPSQNGLQVPGMVIGSRLDDVYTQWVPFLVDLGGDDRYEAPNAGGVLPMERGTAVGQHAKAPDTNILTHEVQPPTDVVLLLDVSPDGLDGGGSDVYAPAPCRVDLSDNQHFEEIQRHGSVSSRQPTSPAAANPAPPVYAEPAACSSLGGALNGVAVLADGGGSNTFSSSLRLNVTAVSTSDLPEQATVRVSGYGVTQGAGLFGGVGMLVTWDAMNTFHADTEVLAQEARTLPTPSGRANGVAQGAGLGGVGILASFGLTRDSYTSNASAEALHNSGDRGVAQGLSQGAGVSGIGLLFDEGGDNTYMSQQGYSQGFAAGRVLERQETSYPHSVQGTGTRGTTSTAEPSLGALWSGPGNDRFQASTFSQASATGREGGLLVDPGTAVPYYGGAAATALLLDAGGNDHYVVGPATSYPARGCPWLAPEPSCAMSQGAAVMDSLALLIDGDGDDRYEAPALTHAQGVGVMGTGLLLDQAGHDSYVAGSRSQGYGSHDAALAVDGQPRSTTVAIVATHNVQRIDLFAETATLGALADLGGSDHYRLDRQGQGLGVATVHELGGTQQCANSFVGASTVSVRLQACGAGDQTCVGSTQPVEANPCDMATASLMPPSRVACVAYCPTVVAGLFLDAHGSDTYDHGQPDEKREAPESTRTGDDNDWMWLQGEDPAQSVPSGREAPFVPVGIGVDNSDADALLQSFWMVAGVVHPVAGPAPAAVEEVEILMGSTPVGDGSVEGDVLLRTRVSAAPQHTIERVTFLADGEVVGHGEPVGTAGGGPRTFQYTWNTRSDDDTARQQRFPDGAYEVVATAVVHPGADAGRGIPSGAGVLVAESEPRTVLVDNPPLVEASLSQSLIRAGRETSQLTVVVGPDEGSGSGGTRPGGTVHVQAQRLADGTTVDLVTGYRDAGVIQVPVGGQCGGGPCPDGLYRLTAQLVDGGGKTAVDQKTLVVDGTPPASRVALPAVAGLAHQSSSGGVNIAWEHSDLPPGLGAGNASGVANVRVLMLAEDDSLLRDLDPRGFGPNVRSADLSGVDTGDRVRIITVATDALGFSESPCTTPDEARPCYRAKLRSSPDAVHEMLVDFRQPILSDLRSSVEFVRPGAPVLFTIKTDDTPGSGVESAVIRFSGGFSAPMEALGDGVYGYADWGLHNLDDPADEQAFSYNVLVTDRGGNRATRAATGVLDGLAPRVTPLETAYPTPEEATTRAAARPGTTVGLRAQVSDAAVQAVSIDLSALQPGGDPQPCSLDPDLPSVWRCDVAVPLDTPDGDYLMQWTATDVAGNVNGTQASLVRVSGRTPQILDLTVVESLHDGVVVRWRTDVPSSAQVRFGRTTEVTGVTAPGASFGTEHEVRVEGLLPSTGYFLQAVSTGRSGVANASALLRADTMSAYVLDIPRLPVTPLRGNATVELELTFLEGDQPVDLLVSLQDEAERASPAPVATLTALQGTVDLTFDTTQVADGAYRLLVDGSRAGDFNQHRSGVVRVDNTPPVLSPLEPRPGGDTAESRPHLRLAALDPLSPEPPLPHGARILVDGQRIAHAVPHYEPATQGGQVLVTTLERDLADGEHRIEVRLPDLAGNVGVAAWNVTVDTRGPAAVAAPSVSYLPGPAAARPGGGLRVVADLHDRAGVAAAWLDLPGVDVPLTHDGLGRWRVDAPLPADLPGGVLPVPLVARDALGNENVTATLRVLVDARPPDLLNAVADEPGFTGFSLGLVADEPVNATAEVDGKRFATPAADARHTLVLDGLTPGAAHRVRIDLVDEAGNNATFWIEGHTVEDLEGPGAVQLAVASDEEGVVGLSWKPAEDNAGISHYRVERRVGSQWGLLTDAPADATGHVDADAPAGEMIGYRVTAVDVAGLTGPSVAAEVRVLALPHLSDASLTPEAGRSNEPFTFRVTYWHAGGLAPERIEVRYGDLAIPLRLLGDATDCRRGCTYGTEAALPPTSIASAPKPTFVAAVDGHEARLSLDWSPRVTAAGAGLGSADDPAGKEAPLVPLPILLLAMLAATAHATRRRKS